MEMHAWFVPTLERLISVMSYPDKANEFASAKVTPAAARQALQLLLNHMRMDTPAPRIEPTTDGGLRFEWHEYWIDCSLVVSPDGNPWVDLSINRDAPIDGYRSPIDESGAGYDPATRLLEQSLRLISELLGARSAAPSEPVDKAVTPPSDTKG